MTDSSFPSSKTLSGESATIIAALCDQFARQWKQWRSDRPQVEQFLSKVDPPARERLLAELLRLELAFRQQHSETVELAEFQQRFPDRDWLEQLFLRKEATFVEASPVQPESETVTRETLSHIPSSSQGTNVEKASSRAELSEVLAYDVLEEIGRGGMGVVYKARHRALDRVVALKMIRTGADADEADLSRFRIEAEAVARLQHPNIVQIFEIGEQNGNPFFSLEYCSGGTLADKLSDSPLLTKEAATLVASLARAIYAAHQANVLHRDLKPANVLFTQDGQAKIADFGLAKKLDQASEHTQTGAIMGTPSYMAPEQAGGSNELLSPQTDVYALGAILYTSLTGHPPFKGATPWETIRLVLEAEPVPPRQLQPSIPRDLETICLKCLEKEPPNRYDSALSLAEELERFQKHEPIYARPVGRWERTTKWARRNPVVAGLLATVLAVLVAGVAVSTWFAVDATEQAHLARQNEASSKNNELRATRNAAELKKTNETLNRSQDELEATLARSLLRPLGKTDGPMSSLEVDTLWELASGQENSLKYRFVREALQDPVDIRKLRSRSGPALTAVVGLSEARRAEVERLLNERLSAPDITPELRTDLFLIAASLGEVKPETAALAVRPILDRLRTAKSRNSQWELSELLANVVACLEPDEAISIAPEAMGEIDSPEALAFFALQMKLVLEKSSPNKDTRELCNRTAKTLVPALAKTPEPFAKGLVASGLCYLTEFMESEKAFAVLVEAVSRAGNSTGEYLPGAPDAVTTLRQRMENVVASMQADAAVTLLTQTMKSTDNPTVSGTMAQVLETLASRLDLKERVRVCTESTQLLVERMQTTQDPLGRITLARGVASLFEKLEARESNDVCSKASALLNETLSRTRDATTAQQLAQALSPFAAHIAVNQGLNVVPKPANPGQPSPARPIVETLVARASRMEPAEAAKILTQTIEKTTDPYYLRSLYNALLQVTKRTKPGAAFQILDSFLEDEKASNFYPDALAQVVTELAPRLQPAQASRLLSRTADLLAEQIFSVRSDHALPSLTQSLERVVKTMEAKESQEICSKSARSVLDRMRKTNDVTALNKWARVLSAVAGQLAPKEATDVCGQALTMLSKGMSQASGVSSLSFSTSTLCSVASHLDPKLSIELSTKPVEVLLEAIGKARSSDQRYLATALTVVATKLQPKRSANLILEAMTESKNGRLRLYYLSTLVTVIGSMDVTEARELGTRVGPLVFSESAASSISVQPRDLQAFVERLEPKQVLAWTMELLEMQPTSPLLTMLTPALGAVMGQLESAEAKQLRTDLVTALFEKSRKTQDSDTLKRLTPVLCKVLATMEPAESDPLCSQLADLLITKISASNNPREQSSFSEMMAQVAEIMEADKAVASCLKVMTGSRNPAVRLAFATGIERVAARLDSKHANQLRSQVFDVLLESASKTRDPQHVHQLVSAGITLAIRMNPELAQHVHARLADLLVQRIVRGRIDNYLDRARFVIQLSEVVKRMEPERAVSRLSEVMNTLDPIALEALVPGLANVASRLSPGDATRLCAQGLKGVTNLLSRYSNISMNMVKQMVTLTPYMEPNEAARLLTDSLSRTENDEAELVLTETLTRVAYRLQPNQAVEVLLEAECRINSWNPMVLGGESTSINPAVVRVFAKTKPHDPSRSFTSLASAVCLGATQPLSQLPSLFEVQHPCWDHLTPQQLVELLAHPTCYGGARRAVLDQLERVYERKFANRWDFVRYARRHHPELKLTVVPRRTTR